MNEQICMKNQLNNFQSTNEDKSLSSKKLNFKASKQAIDKIKEADRINFIKE